MSNYKRFVPFSVLSLVAAAIAMAIAWDPGEAEANKPTDELLVLRSSIVEDGSVAVAPACPDAVWPYVTPDCLLHPNRDVAGRKVRTIEIDDRTIDARHEELRRIVVGR